jgi:hypothetical protein
MKEGFVWRVDLLEHLMPVTGKGGEYSSDVPEV